MGEISLHLLAGIAPTERSITAGTPQAERGTAPENERICDGGQEEAESSNLTAVS